jgi:hypothetical protein
MNIEMMRLVCPKRHLILWKYFNPEKRNPRMVIEDIEILSNALGIDCCAECGADNLSYELVSTYRETVLDAQQVELDFWEMSARDYN